MQELLQSGLFQFIVLLASIVTGTTAIVWKIATYSNRLISTQEKHAAQLKRLEHYREADDRRITRLEYLK